MHLTLNDWMGIISFLVAIEMAIGHGTVELTNALPAKWIPTVQAWCNILALVGASMVTAISRIAAVVLLALVLWPVAGWAQAPKPRPALTGDLPADVRNAINPAGASGPALPGTDNAVLRLLAKPFQDLADFVNGDAVGAAQLAVAVPELQDGTGLACWTAMQTAGRVFKAHPVPLTFHAMTDFQSLRLIVMATNKLCDEPACTVVFSDGVNIAQAAAPVTIAGIPSLSQLCSKVAHIQLSVPKQSDLDALKAATAAPPANP